MAGVGGSTGTTASGATEGHASTGASSTDPGSASGDQDSGADSTSAPADSTSAASTTAAPTSGESDTGDDSTGPPTLCDRALFVTGADPPGPADAPYHDRLMQLGVDVTVVASAVAQASDVGDNCVLVISASVSSSDIQGEFFDATVPLITWESAAYPDLRLVDPRASGAHGVVEPADDVEIVDAAHPIAAGLEGTVAVFEGGGRIGWGTAPGAHVVAIIPGEPTRATVFAFEPGAAMGGGFVAPAARVALPGGSTAATPTADALAIFEAALWWAAAS